MSATCGFTGWTLIPVCRKSHIQSICILSGCWDIGGLESPDKIDTMYCRGVVKLHKSFRSNFMSFRWSDHEKAVGALARRLGFTQVSLSSEVMPMVRAVPRGYTVCADAYLTPKIRQYLKGFTSGFKGDLKVCLHSL